MMRAMKMIKYITIIIIIVMKMIMTKKTMAMMMTMRGLGFQDLDSKDCITY